MPPRSVESGGSRFRHFEPLSGGLVTSRDPALLQPGELSDMRNATYKRGSQALHRAPGRLLWATVTANAANVNGLRDVTFDNGDHFLVALATVNGFGRIRTSPVGASGAGSFIDLGNFATAIPGAASLETVHFRNRFFTFNGISSTAEDALTTNGVIYLSATAPGQVQPLGRQHGLLPVNSIPQVTITGGIFSQTVTGFYEYWVTEIAKITQDGADLFLESGYTAQATTVQISATGSQVPIIPRPVFRNTISNRWRVYRSAVKQDPTDRLFPIGFAITDDLSSAESSHSDTQTVTTSSFKFPTAFNSGTVYSGFTNASNMGADDGSTATAPVGLSRQGCYSFNFSGISGAINGIELLIKASTSTGTAPIKVYIGKSVAGSGLFLGQAPGYDSNWGKTGLGQLLDSGLVASKSGTILTTGASFTTLTLGGQNDRWFPTDNPYALTAADFNGNNVLIVVEFNSATQTLNVDYVKVRLHTLASVETEIPFPSVSYTFGDTTSFVPKNGPPPSSTTGDIYQDSLVVNDVSNSSLIRYSYPGEPESFPGTYFIDFETERNDIVRVIRAVNSRLVVLLDSSTWRVNYLPSERDASFDRGKAIEPITRSFGCVNAMCAATFSITGRTEQLAFVSRQGIHATDGYNFETLTDAIDWRKVISTSVTSYPICLINDPEQHALILYYRNDTQVASLSDSLLGPVSNQFETYFALRLHYGTEHLRDGGRLRISGPTHMRNYDPASDTYAGLRSAWPVVHTSGNSVIYLGYGTSPAATQQGLVVDDVPSGHVWTSWQTSASAVTNLYTSLNKAVSSDTLYIQSIDSGVETYAAQLTTTLANMPDLDNHVLTVRCRKTSAILAGDKFTFQLRVGVGGTPFFTRSTTSALSTGFTTYTFPLTTAERLLITDYTQLQLLVSFTSTSSSGARFQVSWAQLVIPGVGSTAPGAGKVFYETGHALPAHDPGMSFTTRRFYLAGMGNEWIFQTLRGYMASQSGSPVMTYTALSTKTNFAGEETVQSPEFTLNGELMHRVKFNRGTEGLRLQMNVIADHNDMGEQMLILDGEPGGEEDSLL